VFGFGKKSSDDERKKAEEKTTKVTSKDSKKEDAELTKAKSKSSLNKVDRDDEEPEVVVYDRSEGPHDIGEVDDTEEYIDLGALYIKMLDGLNLRLEMDEGTGAVIAATCIRAGGTLQIQAFAAPRSTGIWDDIRHDLAESVASQGGTAEMYTGEFGAEMLTRLPATTEDGKRGERIARFVGVDGPRWFLRGVISGEAVLGNEEDAEAHDRLICLSTGKDLDDPNRMRYTKQEWMKTTAEMNAIFEDLPETLSNTLEILDKVEFYSIDNKALMPDFPIPPEYKDDDD